MGWRRYFKGETMARRSWIPPLYPRPRETVHSLNNKECPFSHEEMALLYQTIGEALAQIRDSSKKDLSALNGEIYTNLRRLCRSGSLCGDLEFLSKILGQKRRAFGLDSKSTYVKGMIDEMKKDYLNDAKDGLEQLRLALAGMDSAQAEMARITQQAERVSGELREIDRILNPTEKGTESNV